jgi:hypothetical protein
VDDERIVRQKWRLLKATFERAWASAVGRTILTLNGDDRWRDAVPAGVANDVRRRGFFGCPRETA